MDIKVMPAGDSALVVEFGNEINEAINEKVHALAKKIRQENIPGITEMIPTFRSLLVSYDMLQISYSKLSVMLSVLSRELEMNRAAHRRIVKIPCCYGARFGADLTDMERLTGLSREEIIELHSSVDYKIYMLGFLPGFVYLGGLDKRLEVPRLDTPRVRIGKGAVGIGGNQTGIYPMDSPGGWRLIGGTPVDLYDPEREDPVLLRAGEYIRFVPISIMDYYDIRQEILKGTYSLDVIQE
mgnify:FL=1